MVYLAPTAGGDLDSEFANPWVACQHTWWGVDGSEWDLSHGLSGLALQTGVRGMRMPPVVRYSTKSPAVAGSFFRGVITDEREVFWPIKVWADAGSQAWIDLNNRFWASLDEGALGTWVITQLDGTRRALQCRYNGLADDSDDIDSGLQGWAVYGINLIAEQPYWTGVTATRFFSLGVAGQNFFGGTSGGGYGPPFYISTGSTAATASITNEGDVSAWPTWTIKGPMTSVVVGLNGHLITFPAVSAGNTITLNTDPTDQVAYDQAGSDITALLTTVDFAPIPPGVEVPLTVTVVGTGTVRISVVPLYKRGL